jgi:hypothetical protein
MAHKVTDQEIAEARARGAQMQAAGLAATGVVYEPRRRRIILELTNGAMVGIPVASLPHIAGATDDVLAAVELEGDDVVRIDSLDADYSVAGLVATFVGRIAAIETGRTGGKARSDAKASAARANGAKGGRPRTRTDTITMAAMREPSAKGFYTRSRSSLGVALTKKAAKKKVKRKK